MEWISFIAILKRGDFKLLKNLQCCRNPDLDLVRQHAREYFPIGSSHPLEQKIDFVLIRDEVLGCIRIPNSVACSPCSNLPLPFFTYLNKSIDDVPIFGWFFVFVHAVFNGGKRLSIGQ